MGHVPVNGEAGVAVKQGAAANGGRVVGGRVSAKGHGVSTIKAFTSA